MKASEKKVTYQTTNTYTTLNDFNPSTRNVWIVFHGISYLSRYFLRYFNELPKNENYIIAPQAPSKYYLNNQYRHVGASWLTRENTASETGNVLSYLDAVLEAEQISMDHKLIIFGYSQGVSIALRWLAKRQLHCHQLVLYAGGIPKELTSYHFHFIDHDKTKIKILVGDRDSYFTEELQRSESEKIDALFEGKAENITFSGGHEIKKELINGLV